MTRDVLDLRANAKVNLFLRVVGRRVDGYHDIETIFHSVGLSDDLRVERIEGRRPEVSMRFAQGVTGEVPPPETNLAYRAAARFLERTGVAGNVRIDITKRIPIGGGLAGGSADAAATLVAMRQLFGTGDDVLLEELARELGSDVPYCLRGGSALATGRGEKLTSLPNAAEMWLVLGLSNAPLLTRDVYAAWDERERASAPTSTEFIETLGSDFEGVAARVHNDLEAAAFSLRPELRAKKQALIDAGGLGALLCGSGPSLFAITRDEQHAHAVATSVRGVFDRVEIAPSREAGVDL